MRRSKGHIRENRRMDKWCMKLAWWLPRRLVMWTYIRLVAHATMGQFGNTVPDELTVMEALKRWDDPRGGDKHFGGAPAQ